MDSVRIDIWLWAVRLFKTRSLASQACRAGHVKISGDPVKPSRLVRVGDKLDVRTGGFLRQVEVVAVLTKRVGAKLVDQYLLDTTPAEWTSQKELILKSCVGRRDRGMGRPTKKDRRSIDRLIDRS